MKRQLSTKFEECILKNDAAMPLTISNFSGAWQAYFLTYTLQILCENTTFTDVEMMCNDNFDISSGFRFSKISVECSVHFYSLYLAKCIMVFAMSKSLLNYSSFFQKSFVLQHLKGNT